jgi:hypothetical protein
MDPELLSIIGERKKYDYMIIPKKEHLTTQIIPLVRQIYKRTVKELYNSSKKEVTVIGYLESVKPKLKKSEQEKLKKMKIPLDSISKYSLFAETSHLQTNAFVLAEPQNIENNYLPAELLLERLSENLFYLKDSSPTYMKAEGLELEKPSLTYLQLIKHLSKYSHHSPNSGRHIFQSLTFPYIGCRFCKGIADGFGVAQFSSTGEESQRLAELQKFQENLNCNQLGIPFNHFGILTLLGEKDIPKIETLRTKMKNEAQNISWINTCEDINSNILKLSEVKYCLQEPIFYENSYKEVKTDLDLRYSMLLYNLKPKEGIKETLWNRGMDTCFTMLKGYTKTLEEKKTLYGFIIDQKNMPLLVGRVLSLSSAVNLSEEDSLTMLKTVISRNIEEITDKISRRLVSEEVYEEVDPKIIFSIATSEDKSFDGLINSLYASMGSAELDLKDCKRIVEWLINELYLIKKGNEYLYLGYTDFNIKPKNQTLQ